MQTETKYMWEETSHLEPLSVKILQWRMEELENSRITKEWKVEEDSEQMEVKYIFSEHSHFMDQRTRNVPPDAV